MVVLGLAELEELRRALVEHSSTAAETDTQVGNQSTAVTMSVGEAARYLGISRSHAYDLVRGGEIPHLRLGRRVVVPRRELDAMIARQTRAPSPDSG